MHYDLPLIENARQIIRNTIQNFHEAMFFRRQSEQTADARGVGNACRAMIFKH